jgi:amphi-Trp domain-containing protein
MTELKYERKDTLSRRDAVQRLRAVADALDGDERSVELELESDSIEFPMGSEVRFELEVELDDDELELELELKWSTAKPAPKQAAS